MLNQLILLMGERKSFILLQPPLVCFQSRYLPDSIRSGSPQMWWLGRSAEGSCLQLCRACPGSAVETSLVSPSSLGTSHAIDTDLCGLGPGWQGHFLGQELSGWRRSTGAWFVVYQEEGPFTQAALARNYLPSVACQLVPAGIQETLAGSSVTCAFALWADCRDCVKLNLGWEVYFAWL